MNYETGSIEGYELSIGILRTQKYGYTVVYAPNWESTCARIDRAYAQRRAVAMDRERLDALLREKDADVFDAHPAAEEGDGT